MDKSLAGGIAGAYPPKNDFAPVNRPTNTRRLILPTDHKRRLHEWKINHHDSKPPAHGPSNPNFCVRTPKTSNKDRANLIAADARRSRPACLQGGHRLSRYARALPRDFHRTQAGSITNSGASGRC